MEAQSLAEKLRRTRAELMSSEVEVVALRLFAQRGFTDVTVDEIASETRISARTFYRYFPTKEDVLQVRIDRRTELLREALARRPPDDPPLHVLGLAVAEMAEAEDTEILRRWMEVIAATPITLKAVIGGIQLKTTHLIAEYFGERLGHPADEFVPTMLAAAAGGVLQAAHTRWFLKGGDLASMLTASLEVLDSGIGALLQPAADGRAGSRPPRVRPEPAAPRARAG